MSVRMPTGPGPARYPGDPYDTQSRGEGWNTFAGIMLMIIGAINVIGGIGAIDDSKFYLGNAEFLISDLNTWGWVILATGAAQVLTAIGLWVRNQFARWLGVAFASLNALAQSLMIPAFPLWSLTIFAVDMLIIYGLIVYGGRNPAPTA